MLALKQGEGKDFWSNKPPNSRYPTGGISFEGLGVPVKSDHHKTGNGFIYSHSKARNKSPWYLQALDPPPSLALAFPSTGGRSIFRKVSSFLRLSEETE